MATRSITSKQLSWFKREPVAVINAINGVIQAGIALLVAFGLGWSTEQVGAVMGFTIAVGAVVSTLASRSQTTALADPKDETGQPLLPASNDT
jgi:hypothetical protein